MAVYKLMLIALVTLGASFVQGVTGFGFGIVAIIFLPHLLLYTEANALSSIPGCVTSVMMMAALYRKTTWKNLLFPLIGSFAANYLAVSLVKSAENDVPYSRE